MNYPNISISMFKCPTCHVIMRFNRSATTGNFYKCSKCGYIDFHTFSEEDEIITKKIDGIELLIEN